MVDGVILVVDAFEGPQTQTRFVIGKALSNCLKIVVINKVDRDSVDICHVLDQLFNNDNLKRIKGESAHSGDIVAIIGCNNLYVGETISSLKKPEALPIIKIHEPKMKMTFLINDSPFAGHERSILTVRKLRNICSMKLEKM